MLELFQCFQPLKKMSLLGLTIFQPKPASLPHGKSETAKTEHTQTNS